MGAKGWEQEAERQRSGVWVFQSEGLGSFRVEGCFEKASISTLMGQGQVPGLRSGGAQGTQLQRNRGERTRVPRARRGFLSTRGPGPGGRRSPSVRGKEGSPEVRLTWDKHRREKGPRREGRGMEVALGGDTEALRTRVQGRFPDAPAPGCALLCPESSRRGRLHAHGVAQ